MREKHTFDLELNTVVMNNVNICDNKKVGRGHYNVHNFCEQQSINWVNCSE